jgi:hypothetical protein
MSIQIDLGDELIPVTPDEMAQVLVGLTEHLDKRYEKHCNLVNVLLFNVDKRLVNGCYLGLFKWRGWECLVKQLYGVLQISKKKDRMYSQRRFGKRRDMDGRADEIKEIVEFLNRDWNPEVNIGDRKLGASELPTDWREAYGIK